MAALEGKNHDIWAVRSHLPRAGSNALLRHQTSTSILQFIDCASRSHSTFCSRVRGVHRKLSM